MTHQHLKQAIFLPSIHL